MAKQFNSPGFGINVGLQSLIIDNNNEIMIFGRFRGSVDFDPGAGTHILSSNNDNNFLLKLDSTGAFIWAKKFGNNNSTISADRAVFDGAQSVYFAGSFYNNNDFDPNSTVYYMTGGTNFFNGFVLKLNTEGEFLGAQKLWFPPPEKKGGGGGPGPRVFKKFYFGFSPKPGKKFCVGGGGVWGGGGGLLQSPPKKTPRGNFWGKFQFLKKKKRGGPPRGPPGGGFSRRENFINLCIFFFLGEA
ncbi:MAG: hypothetical protein IPL22_06450 [Bacteroidetes bacterium]|nr:hypothetical protein [Bacteroidota bacterium]